MSKYETANGPVSEKRDADNGDESFIRWQGRLLKQMGFFNNLLLGLTTGLIAFQTQLAFDQGVSLMPCEIVVLLTSILILFLSILVGCYLAWNRLNDFRFTAQIARKRENGQLDGIGKLRRKSDRFGERTWNLIQWQAALFVLGSLLLFIATIGRYVA